jgi:hypothetical protein
LALGGATPWNRDTSDNRVIDTVISETGAIINEVSDIGGFPPMESAPPPEDSDNDGMPDFWERAMGLDPSDPADRKNKDTTGYTMPEGYLNWLADGHAVCDRNGSVDVNLQTLNGGLTFLNYTVASGSNGTVTLPGDGHTARFTAASDYSGLADFTYTAADPATGFSFGPVKVGVLITGTGGPAPTPADCVLGDVNNDGNITITDALFIAQHYVGLIQLPELCAADVNCDGIISIVDALLCAQYYVGLISSFC